MFPRVLVRSVSSSNLPELKPEGEINDERIGRRDLPPRPFHARPRKGGGKATLTAELRDERTALAPVSVREAEDGWPVLAFPGGDYGRWMAQAKTAFSTPSDAFVEAQIDALVRALGGLYGRPPAEVDLNAALALIAGVEPTNEVEAALAVQMALAHAAAVHLLGRALQLDLVLHPNAAMTGVVASKIMRAFATHAEALAKLRRPSEQTVVVKRVVVQDGGQAIVGAVQTGGGRRKKEPTS